MTGGRRATPVSGTPMVATRPVLGLILVLATIAALTVPYLQRLLADDDDGLGVLTACATSTPQLVVVVLDVSSSVIDRGGADPAGRSFDESIRVAEMMRDAPCTSDDRFGAVIFADQAVEVPPILVSSHSIIEATIKRPPQTEIGAGTRIAPALRRTQQIANRHPDHHTSVIVLSDMVTEEDVSDALERLRLAGLHSLHLVALGTHDSSSDHLFDAVMPLAHAGQGDVGRALVNAVNESRGRS